MDKATKIFEKHWVKATGKPLDEATKAHMSYAIEAIDEALHLGTVSGSWLDHHILNEDSEINGVIIKHSPSPEIYGGVGVETNIGNFAIVKEHQEKAAKNIGAQVLVKPHKDYYGTVMILLYHDI